MSMFFFYLNKLAVATKLCTRHDRCIVVGLTKSNGDPITTLKSSVIRSWITASNGTWLSLYFPRSEEWVECCHREDGHCCESVEVILVDIRGSAGGRNDGGRHGWYQYRCLATLTERSLMRHVCGSVNRVSIGSRNGWTSCAVMGQL